MKLINVMHQVSSIMSDKQLLSSGDIETNPGPIQTVRAKTTTISINTI